jgi:formylglycine-generating enzyme
MKKTYLTLTIFVICIIAVHNTHGEETGMVLISAGEFNIGESTTTVHLEDYYIDKTEVTQKEFKKVIGPSKFFFKGENHPAEQINWYKANEYCKKIGKRLPSELEWEKAAKGGERTKYFWGMKPDADYAWYGGDYDLGHHPVGKKKPNNFGLHDTSGNVWEWTSTKGETKSKFSGEKINKRIAKGGAFNVSANLITSSNRLSLFSKNRLFNVGFRCAK